MFILLGAVTGLCLVLWLLVRLKEEREANSGPPNDETTLVLGMFYSLSQACVKYYRERGKYPSQVAGTKEGLFELGYLKDSPVAKEVSTMSLFQIVATESSGQGLCLFNSPPSLVTNILDRMDKQHLAIKFMKYNEYNYHPIERPVRENVNLTLPLPFKPAAKRQK